MLRTFITYAHSSDTHIRVSSFAGSRMRLLSQTISESLHNRFSVVGVQVVFHWWPAIIKGEHRHCISHLVHHLCPMPRRSLLKRDREPVGWRSLKQR